MNGDIAAETAMAKDNIRDILALTPMQEGILFHFLREPAGGYYFEQLSLALEGEIRRDCFRSAWDRVAEQNEMLRTLFRWEGIKQPVQVILKQHPVRPRFRDFPAAGAGDMEKQLAAAKAEDRAESFSLSGAPPFRVTLCSWGGRRHEMIVGNHHILYDGWSNGILLKEFFRAYHQLSRGTGTAASNAKTPFKEYVKSLETRDPEGQQGFWKQYLEGFETRTGLPVAPTRVNGRQPGPARHLLESQPLPPEPARLLESFSRAHRVSPAAVYHTAYGLLLRKYNWSNDVLFGSTVSGRSAKIKGIEEMVGLFINTLPLRIKPRPGETVASLVDRVNRDMRQREAYESTPLTEIKALCRQDKHLRLFDSIMVMENYPLEETLRQAAPAAGDAAGEAGGHGLTVTGHSMSEMTHYPLTVGISGSAAPELQFSYDGRLFPPGAVRRLFRQFQGILSFMVQRPGGPIRDIELVTEDEKQHLLYRLNQSAEDYPGECTVDELVDRQARQTPDLVAVAFRDEQMTYRELNRRAGLLALHLQARGVTPGLLVALLLERSLEMVTGMLAVLKSGGAYVPLDSAQPEQRLRYLAEDSGAHALLTGPGRLPHNGGQWREIFGANIIPVTVPGEPVPGGTVTGGAARGSGDPAYVIYTSGTTGRPKGVMAGHRNLVNYLAWLGKRYHMGPYYHCLQLLDYTFDPSGADIFASLTRGATVFIGEKHLIFDKETFGLYVRQRRIRMLNMVPGPLEDLLANQRCFLDSIETVIVGGQAIGYPLKEKLLKRGYAVYNHYGPTETTIDAAAARLLPGEAVSIGVPVANTRLYVLDLDGAPAPPGLPGELCVAGDGVTRGYLNNPRLTAERFVKNPHVPGEMFYKTGDRVLRRGDGGLEFLHRLDSQVKLRGYRIELGEIENRIREYGPVKEAVVVVRQTRTGADYLHAFWVPGAGEDGGDTAAGLKQYLGKVLPEYMIPPVFTPLREIPRLPSGKPDLEVLDNKNLPGPASGENFEPPKSETEKLIASIWRELLGLEQVGVHDDFFTVGGNSLVLIRLFSRFKQHFPRSLTVQTLFDNRTVKKQAEAVARLMTAGAEQKEPAAQPGQTGQNKQRSRVVDF